MGCLDWLFDLVGQPVFKPSTTQWLYLWLYLCISRGGCLELCSSQEHPGDEQARRPGVEFNSRHLFLHHGKRMKVLMRNFHCLARSDSGRWLAACAWTGGDVGVAWRGELAAR